MSGGDARTHADHLTTRDTPGVFCVVACIEYVDYAHKPVAAQLACRTEVNAMLVSALARFDPSERIVLEGEEGVAIVLLCQPQRGLAFALALRDALSQREVDAVRVRVGLNIGPIRLLDGDRCAARFAGDALLVARSIALFADPDRILASRSFHDALGDDCAHCFRFEGVRTDSQLREYHLYALRDGVGTPSDERVTTRAWAGGRIPRWRGLRSGAAAAWARLLSRPSLATGLVAALVVGGAIAVRVASDEPVTAAVAMTGEAVPAQPPVLSPPLSATGEGPVAGPSLDDDPLRVQGQTPQKAAEDLPRAMNGAPADKSASAPAAVTYPSGADNRRVQQGASERSPAAAPRSLAAQDSPVPGRDDAAGPGAVRLTVVPWGEIYLDGEMLGVAPPLRDIALEPGVYRIEIRNPGFASLLQVVEVNAGKEIRIRHKFD